MHRTVASSRPGAPMVDLPETSATLWSPPDGPPPDPPVDTKTAVLPLGQLAWEDTERLFVRLLETEVDVERAALFGLPGQAQQGIDVYGRLIPTLGNSPGGAANFVSLQSRRIKKPTAAGIEKAANDFLAEEWADRSARFYYATSASLRDTKLDAAVRAVTDRLHERGIEFVPWGLEEVSEQLRNHPHIVDDFFGRAWVEKFCGTDQVAVLSRRITAPQVRDLRAALGNLYRGAFRAYGASPTVTSAAALPFIVLDTVPVAAEPEFTVTSDRNPEDVTEPSSVEDGFVPPSFARRRTTRPRRAASTTLATETMALTPADEWMAGASLRLLIGTPGSGKSSFLMFAATDLLSTSPQSAALQRAHGGALPLWLPFAFLCRHLDESTSNSVISAVRAWTTQQGGEQTWAIIEPALDDDRVVLLVDGVDEWNDITKADQALGLIESFVSQRNIAATLSARPYALTRLNWTLPWEKAALAPLTSTQQLRLAHRALAEAEPETLGTDAVPTSPAAEEFLTELEQVPALAPLIATPLFLCLLAKSWRGEALSPQRFRLFSDLERILIERHPQMRRRASSATGSEFPTTQMQAVLRGVAYRARLETGSALTTRSQMEQWFREELAAPDGLGYSPPEAHRVATALLGQAEDEYGLLVPQGIGMVGFLHRVLLDQLAGEHLATRPPDEISASLRVHAADPNWRDVLITALSAQVSAHMNAAILEELVADAAIEDVDKWELVATAVAAGVAISQTALTAWVDEIIARTAEHYDGAHRAELARSLVGMTRHPALRARLLPVFSRWLSASHPEPISPIWALRDAPVDDSEALTALLWAIRHEDENVQLNAAHALATRFAGDPTVKSQVIDRVREGATSIHQAFALLSLGTGWPDAAELSSLVQWARAQPISELRICALHLAAADNTASFEVTDGERRWLQDLLRHERLRPHEPWMQLAMPFIVQAVQSQPGARAFILDTLANNGRNGGNRYLAWYLACTTFSDDIAIRDWAAGELGDPEQRGLILYNLTLIPEVWRADPDFVRRASVTVRRDAGNTPYSADVIGLSTSMPDDEALEALLPALDSFRPAAAAFALLDRFGEDPRAINPIKARLNGEYETAARLAPVAFTALGADAGFDRLVDLLRAEGTRSDGEDRVVIAQAVADAWVTLNLDAGDTATEVLSRYDEAELAARCTAVGTGMLTWHVGSVITAWPAQPAVMEFALEALRHPRGLTRGIVDPAPAAILRAYAPRADPVSKKMVTAVLDQLAYLPPDTREVLTVALTESDLSPAVLIELLRDWDYDPDIWVQRAAISGLVRRHNRYRLSAGADAAEIDDTGSWLREQVRAQLCAYGPYYEDRRQNAWVAMLLLGEPTLHDGLGLVERIVEPTRPGVQLTHVLGGVDLEFVDLLNANWGALTQHVGEEELFLLLSGARTKDRRENDHGAARQKVLLQLTRAPSPHPRIRDLIVTAAESDSTFRSDPAFLIWSHRHGRKDTALFEACLNALRTRRFNEETHGLYDILVETNAWDVSDNAARELMQGQRLLETSDALRSLFAERFPTDPVTRSWYAELEAWFRTDGPREPRQWPETLALAIRASPADVLPTIIERAHEQLHRQQLSEMLGDMTAPLLRRLRGDSEAVAQTYAAMRDPFVARADTPLWRPQQTQRTPALDVAARLSYLHARSLQRAGILTTDVAAEIRSTLLTTGAEVVAHDPFLGVEASLRILSSVLIRRQR